jgi:hypothetical protein
MARMSSLDNNDFPALITHFQKTAEHCKKSLKLLIFTRDINSPESKQEH